MQQKQDIYILKILDYLHGRGYVQNKLYTQWQRRNRFH